MQPLQEVATWQRYLHVQVVKLPAQLDHVIQHQFLKLLLKFVMQRREGILQHGVQIPANDQRREPGNLWVGNHEIDGDAELAVRRRQDLLSGPCCVLTAFALNRGRQSKINAFSMEC